MGSYVLRGVTTALLTTVVTLLAGVLWTFIGFEWMGVSRVLDIGLVISCFLGGYRTAKESNVWFMGGVTAAGYVIVGTLLLALFLPIRGFGFLQVLIEGVFLGLIAGAVGSGKRRSASGVRNRRLGGYFSTAYTPSYAGYDSSDRDDFEWESPEFSPKSKEARQRWLDSYEDEGEIRQETKEPKEGKDFKEGKKTVEAEDEQAVLWQDDVQTVDIVRDGIEKDNVGREVEDRKVIEKETMKWPWDRVRKKTFNEGSEALVRDVNSWSKYPEKEKPWWE